MKKSTTGSRVPSSSATKKLLYTLTNIHGTSGYEIGIRKMMMGEMEKIADEVRIDTLGNVIATKRGATPSVMIAAHMDEIGLMIKSIDKKGYLRFLKLGGWYDATLLNRRVILHGNKGDVAGVIGSKPPHKMKEEERKLAVSADDMFIDIGAANKQEVEKAGISVGTTATLDVELKALLNNRVTGKALDDRIGIAMMIEAVRRTKSRATIYAVGTVQEEVGLKGAKTSAYGVSPDLAIVCEVTHATDYPGMNEKDSPVAMGKGPVITIADASGRGLITSPHVFRWLEKIAKKEYIPFQIEVSDGGTTDATAIHLTKAGIPSAIISIPTRYMHSGTEVASFKDLEGGIVLLARALENLSLLDR